MVCGRCCVNFNFSDDDGDEYEDSDDSDGLEDSAVVGVGAHMEMVPVGPVVGPFPATAPSARSSPPRGSVRVVPAEFRSPGVPADIFRLETALQSPGKRYVRIGNRRQFLVLTDGACVNNGLAILFWHVRRCFNGAADAAAKAAAREPEAPATWADYRSIDFGRSVCMVT
ncbi:hypothetical protein N3K66_005859 [Trichothecium roseum]|uniref:Uncharacterized protein n=1 Tax=Trichothecium roseum TaxID=47278 RepID=A0ACC0UZ29_9HYPO|nr:hypothetical protein N3K66_005859 [Trichothecium roseum]